MSMKTQISALPLPEIHKLLAEYVDVLDRLGPAWEKANPTFYAVAQTAVAELTAELARRKTTKKARKA
jgi:hypothetical protein